MEPLVDMVIDAEAGKKQDNVDTEITSALQHKVGKEKRPKVQIK